MLLTCQRAAQRLNFFSFRSFYLSFSGLPPRRSYLPQSLLLPVRIGKEAHGRLRDGQLERIRHHKV